MASEHQLQVERLADNPVITPASSPVIGTNINGPSVIRVPDWVSEPLGRYYLYFSHHKGKNIRLAYADAVAGPWKVHEPGALSLAASGFPTEIDERAVSPDFIQRVRSAGRDPSEFLYAHIASPEVVVNEARNEIRLYYHGMLADGSQQTRVAISSDGLNFEARPEILTRPYLRVFEWNGQTYGMAMPGVFYRSADGLTNFVEGPTLFNGNMRHAALMVRGSTLYVFWTQVGDDPEHIKLSTIDLGPDWRQWQASEPHTLLMPERDFEGANLARSPSVRGAIETPANQLRDPAIFEEDGQVWLFYAVAGESGIAVARLTGPSGKD